MKTLRLTQFEVEIIAEQTAAPVADGKAYRRQWLRDTIEANSRLMQLEIARGDSDFAAWYGAMAWHFAHQWEKQR